MEIVAHKVGSRQIAEIVDHAVVISTVDNALDIIGNIIYQGFDGVILHAKNFTPGFFDLSTKLAGEILQKFTNYRLRLCITGDFTNVQSKSLRDFISESNKGRQVNFLANTEEAIARFSST